ncbi:MAG: hypothetical protein ACI4BA_02050 [Prevotella sp.]
MQKRLQNHISESRTALPVMAGYGFLVWIAGGLIADNRWLQFAFFALASYLMVELNNRFALIRIYSRMVSCSFIMLGTSALFLFDSFSETVTMFCMVVVFLGLFKTYQNPLATSETYVLSLALGINSVLSVHVLWFVPLIWLLTLSVLQSFSARTWGASLLGLLTPYWFLTPLHLYREDISPLVAHFEQLASFHTWWEYSCIDLSHLLFFALLCLLSSIGIFHIWHTGYNDKIRTRQYYTCFSITNIYVFVLIALQPQLYHALIHAAIIGTSVHIAHFIALTNSKITNLMFCAIIVVVLSLTAFNLWISSSIF